MSHIKETLSQNLCVLNLKLPQDHKYDLEAAVRFFGQLHAIILRADISTDFFSLEISATSTLIEFFIIFPENYKTFVSNQLYSTYPEIQLSEVNDYLESDAGEGVSKKIIAFTLEQPSTIPLRSYKQTTQNQLLQVVKIVSQLKEKEHVLLQLKIRPINHKLKDHENEKFYQFELTAQILADTANEVSRITESIVKGYQAYSGTDLNRLVTVEKKSGFSLLKSKLAGSPSVENKFYSRFLSKKTTNVTSATVIASLFHLPTPDFKQLPINWVASKKLAPPLYLPQQGSRILAETDYRGGHIKFGINTEDRLRHMLILGEKNTGKTNLLKTQIIADIYDGQGLTYFVQGTEDLAEILELIPKHRANDVCIINVEDVEYPVGLNLLKSNTQALATRSEIARLATNSIKTILKESWDTEIEEIFYKAILTLLHSQKVTLLALPRFLLDSNYRSHILAQVTDKRLQKYWQEEFGASGRRRLPLKLREAVTYLQSLLEKPVLRNSLGQIAPKFSFSTAISANKIVLINLHSPQIQESTTELLTSLILSELLIISDIRVGESGPENHYLYLDEPVGLDSDIFIELLKKATKAQMGVIVSALAKEYSSLQSADKINDLTKTKALFTQSQDFAPFTAEELTGLKYGQAYLSLSINLQTSGFFSIKSLIANFPKVDLRAELIKTSRQNYALFREKVEEKINRWADKKL